jgi:hypothetical protein
MLTEAILTLTARVDEAAGTLRGTQAPPAARTEEDGTFARAAKFASR